MKSYPVHKTYLASSRIGNWEVARSTSGCDSSRPASGLRLRAAVATIGPGAALAGSATVAGRTAQVAFSTVAEAAVTHASFLPHGRGSFGGSCHLTLKPGDAACRIEHFEQSLVNEFGTPTRGHCSEFPQVVGGCKDVCALPGLKAHDHPYLSAPSKRVPSGRPLSNIRLAPRRGPGQPAFAGLIFDISSSASTSAWVPARPCPWARTAR
jgi:hypothetical protein